MDLNANQRLYMQTVYDLFQQNLQWPTFRQVQGKILPKDSDFRVLEVARSLKENPGFYFQDLNRPAILDLKEIYQLPTSKQDLSDLMRLINHSVKKYMDSYGEEIQITHEKAEQELHFDEATGRKVIQLLGLTSGIFSSSSISLDHKTWSFKIADTIIDYQGLVTIEDYFRRRDELAKAYQSNLASQSEDVITKTTIGKLEQADPSDIKTIAVSALELSAGYYNEPLKQSRQSFFLMRLAALAFSVLLLGAIVLLFFGQPANIAYIATLGSVLSAAFSGIFFLMYRQTSAQALAYKPQLDKMQNFILANSVCETLDQERKQRSREELVRLFAGLPSTSNEGKIEDKNS